MAQTNEKQDWNTLMLFTNGDPEPGKLAVRLAYREWYGYRAQYKIQVGSLIQLNKSDVPTFVQGFRPGLNTYLGKVGLTSMAKELAGLIEQAEQYAHGDAQSREDQHMEARIQREQRQANRDSSTTRPIRHPGKTAKKKNRRHKADQPVAP
jgi:hypothetical protein